MNRVLTTCAVVLGSAALFGLHPLAQSNETKTKVKTEHAEQVTYTGCIRSGGGSSGYVLQSMPVSRTQTTGPEGTTTTTTYQLVPERVELQSHVGQKVEVSGVMIPAGDGDSKITTRSKVNGKEEKTTTEVERGKTAQLKVLSVRPLGESCS